MLRAGLRKVESQGAGLARGPGGAYLLGLLGPSQALWGGGRWAQRRCLLFTPSTLCPGPGLKLPTSSADTRFDVEGSEGPEGEEAAEERCCPCHPADGQLHMDGEAVSFQKKFENFLHNSIIIPRCWGSWGSLPLGARVWGMLQGALGRAERGAEGSGVSS